MIAWNPEITRAVWHAGDGTESQGGRSRASCPSESNHTCLPACDIIVMRVRALYTPFTAKCSRPVRPAADQQDETTRAATLHRMFAGTSISLDIARRVRLYLAVCVSRVPIRAADCFIHARARMRCYALHARVLKHSVRCPNRHGECETGRPIYIQDPPFSRGYRATFVAPQTKRRSCISV